MALANASLKHRGCRRERKPPPLRIDLKLRAPRLLLVDDHEIGLAALKLYFARRTTFKVITLSLRRLESIQQAKAPRPDLALVNVRMPHFDGPSVTKFLLETAPASKVIGFNGSEDRESVLAMLRAGARGYIVSACGSAELFRALEAVQRGDLFFSPSILRMIADDYALGQAPLGAVATGGLSERDRKIVAFIADGLCNKEIASALSMSVRTIEKYRETLMSKLQIKTISGLTKYAIRHGITTLE